MTKTKLKIYFFANIAKAERMALSQKQKSFTARFKGFWHTDLIIEN